MHILNRLFTLAVCTAFLLPAGTTAMLSLQDREEATSSLNRALDRAVVSYRHRTSLQSLQTRGQKTIDAQAERLMKIAVRQRFLREEILSLRRTITVIRSRYSVTIENTQDVRRLIAEEKKQLAETVRETYVRRLANAQVDSDTRRKLVNVTLADRSPADSVQSARLATVTDAHVEYLEDLLLAEKTFSRLDTLTKEREALLAERLSSSQQLESAAHLVTVTSEQMEEIKKIMTDVHDQVLKMQGDLARIDARLRAKAQRALIEKGLLDPLAPSSGDDSAVRRPAFSWPVYGTVSAGFKNAAYHKHFSVPHYGMDIVVGEATPVRSSADGVVFLVRDGGAKGYTYVLIGHRNGYATLYGHLLSVSVSAGQEVTAGDMIGLSGGRPGTPGAGPMTTGPHLHFEVIQSGVNVDPKTVLP